MAGWGVLAHCSDHLKMHLADIGCDPLLLLYTREHVGYLIVRGNSGLKSALAKHHRFAKNVGLIGKYAPHLHRYAYCVYRIIELRDTGHNHREAMAFVTDILGYGESRVRYVSMVSGGNFGEQFAD